MSEDTGITIMMSNFTATTSPPPSGSSNSSSPSLITYFVLIMLAIFSFVGTVGNALVVYVFSKKNDNQTSTVFMLALAVVDMVTCFIVLPGTMWMEWNKFHIWNDALCKIYQFLTTSNVPYSAFIMTAIAVDRYLCICHPFLHAMNVFRARILITCLGILAGVLGFTAAWLHNCSRSKFFHLCFNTTGLPLYNLTGDFSIISNLTEVPCPPANETVANIHRYVHQETIWTGVCNIDVAYYGSDFVYTYQYVHLSTFPLCIVVVSVLYAMIYKSVLDRRRKRAKMKQNTARVLAVERNSGMDCDETRLTTAQVTINGNNSNDTKHTLSVENPKLKRKSTRKDKNRMQNVRTAMMLFIVTVVFVLSFLPASLMVIRVLPLYIPVFYMYFINNVVNPVIYSFMNKNFRDDLKKVFNCQ